MDGWKTIPFFFGIAVIFGGISPNLNSHQASTDLFVGTVGGWKLGFGIRLPRGFWSKVAGVHQQDAADLNVIIYLYRHVDML